MDRYYGTMRLALLGAAACVVLALLLASIERACARPLNFVLCKHKEGTASAEVLTLSGVETIGPKVIDSSSIIGMIGVSGNKCTVIMLANKGHATVVGSYEEVYCRIYGGATCE